LKTNLIVVALILVLAIGAAAPLQAEKSQPKLTIDITRTAVVGPWGVVHVGDNFTIHNNGTTPVSSLDFGFLRTFRNNVYYLDVKDNHGRELAVDTDVTGTSQFYWVRVHFAQELDFNKTYQFTAVSVLQGVITQVPGGFQFNFTAAPVLTQDARLANVTLIAVPASSFKLPAHSPYISTSLGGQPTLIRWYKPWKAYSVETFYGPYSTVNQYLVDVTSAERNIILRNTGGLSVKETYNFHNNGIPVTTFTITLPVGATNVMAYDVVGAMWASPQNPIPPYQVNVAPRYSAGVRTHEDFTFTLTYDVPQSKYVKQLHWWGTYNLTFAFLDNKDDFVFDQATVRVITPSGVSVGDVKVPAQSVLSSQIQVSPNKRDFNLRGVTSLGNVTFGLGLNYLPFWSAFEFLPWLVSLEVAVAAVVIVARIRRGPELAVPVPVEKLREFVGLYDERLALSRELVVMEEEVARGGLVKHEFRRRTKVMELRLDEINKALMQVKAELRAISARYDDLIRRIDRAEAEVEISRSSMNQVRSQYRAGKTTRETYDSMINDITKRIDRAEQTVETILITLREEAR
jgi:hypothetical protein